MRALVYARIHAQTEARCGFRHQLPQAASALARKRCGIKAALDAGQDHELRGHSLFRKDSRRIHAERKQPLLRGVSAIAYDAGKTLRRWTKSW